MSATYPAGLLRDRGETLALSSTVASLGIPIGVQQAMMYNPATDWRFHVNSAIREIVFFDASASAGSRFKSDGSDTSLTPNLTDRDSTTGSGTAFDSMAVTSDFIYICLVSPVAGLRIVMTSSVNATTNTMKGEYYKNDDTWANLSVTDGTDTGPSLAQTGSVTWTAVTDWKSIGLRKALEAAATPLATEDATNTSGFWMRISFTTGGLDSDTEIEEIWALSNDTNRSYFRAGTEYHFSFDRRSVGAVEAILAAGTDTLAVNWMGT